MSLTLPQSLLDQSADGLRAGWLVILLGGPFLDSSAQLIGKPNSCHRVLAGWRTAPALLGYYLY